MTTQDLPPAVARYADEADLGRLVSTLTPPRASARRTLVVGAIVVAGVVGFASTRNPDAWWAVAGLVVLGLLGLGFVIVGIVELLPGPGRVFLFERGMIRVGADGTIETVPRSPGAQHAAPTPIRDRAISRSTPSGPPRHAAPRRAAYGRPQR